MVNTYGTGCMSDEKMVKLIEDNFDLTPGGIIHTLKLRNSSNGRYRKTAAYGHFGRNEEDFTWERTDQAKALAKYIK